MSKRPVRPSAPVKHKPAVAEAPTTMSWIGPTLPVLAALLLFATGLGNQMLGLDDHSATVENPAVANFSLVSTLTSFNLGMYAPLTWVGHAIAFAIGKGNPFWYHLLSLIVHTINTWLVYRVIFRVSDKTTATVLALLFAIHPIQAESVAWIAGFSTPFSYLFCLLAFGQYLDYASETGSRKKTYALSILFFLLACLTKSSAVTVPITLIVFDLWKKPNLSWRQRIIGYAPFFLISLGFGLLTLYSRQVSGTPIGSIGNGYSPLERVLLISYAPLMYLGKIILPLKLNVYYSFDRINGVLPWYYFAAPVFWAVTGYAAWRLRNVAPYLYIGLAFFLSNLAVTLPITSLGTFELCADHYNYVACIGIFYLLYEGWKAMRQRYQVISHAITAMGYIWVGMLLVFCLLQIRIWKDTITVITNAINNGYAHRGMMYFGRAVEYGDLNRPNDAIQDFTKAIALDSTIADAYKLRGSLYAQLEQLEPAMADFQHSIKMDPKDAAIWSNVGMIYMRKNNFPAAIDAFTKTIELKPDAAIAYQNRAVVHQKMNNLAAYEADVAKAKELSGGRSGKKK